MGKRETVLEKLHRESKEAWEQGYYEYLRDGEVIGTGPEPLTEAQCKALRAQNGRFVSGPKTRH